ncbi:hypothetical protein CKY51_07580 [Xanthomonas maliensis]|nr:hypothetical protein CKY51_07580 [Xanthomonas maliensis]
MASEAPYTLQVEEVTETSTTLLPAARETTLPSNPVVEASMVIAWSLSSRRRSVRLLLGATSIARFVAVQSGFAPVDIQMAGGPGNVGA